MWEAVCGTRPCCSFPCVLGICLTLPSCCVLPDPPDDMSPLPDQLPDAILFPIPPDRKSQRQLSSSCHNSHPTSPKSSLPNNTPKCHNLPDPPQLLQSSWSHTVKPLWFVPFPAALPITTEGCGPDPISLKCPTSAKTYNCSSQIPRWNSFLYRIYLFSQVSDKCAAVALQK